jgi:hypothetical protein
VVLLNPEERPKGGGYRRLREEPYRTLLGERSLVVWSRR